jgi:hypothetical protein
MEVVTEVAVVVAKAADAVVNTLPVHKLLAVRKAMAVEVKAVASSMHPVEMHNLAAMKAALAAAWASVLPAPHQEANPIRCVPVSI